MSVDPQSPPPPEMYIRIGLPEIYAKLVNVETLVANLASNAKHAEEWRVQTDGDLRNLEARVNESVTRKELYSVVIAVAATMSALAPFLSQLYTH